MPFTGIMIKKDSDRYLLLYNKLFQDEIAPSHFDVASNLIGVSRLGFPEQLIEIVFKAVLPQA